MKESDFRQQVIVWCKNHISELPNRIDSLSKANLNRLRVEIGTVCTGWIPWTQYAASSEWIWKPFYREVDIIIGLNVELDEESTLLPLIVFELKLEILIRFGETFWCCII